jgi:hypothetical protein
MDSNAGAHMTPMEIRDSIAVHTYHLLELFWAPIAQCLMQVLAVMKRSIYSAMA